MMLYICTKFHENLSKGLRVTDQTQDHDRWMDKVISTWPPQTLSGGALFMSPTVILVGNDMYCNTCLLTWFLF